MFGLSASELLLVGVIVALVMLSGRVGKVGEAVSMLMAGRKPGRPTDDGRIEVRDGDEHER